MDERKDLPPFTASDETMKEEIIKHIKSQGIFDQMRREILSDFDTKVKLILPASEMIISFNPFVYHSSLPFIT